MTPFITGSGAHLNAQNYMVSQPALLKSTKGTPPKKKALDYWLVNHP